MRIPDVPKLFEHLRPVFTQRLQGQDPADVLLGFFRTHVRFRWDGTEIGSARTASTGCAAGTPTSSQARTST